MPEIVYANTILDPKSQSVDSSDKFFVCEKISRRWHIIEGHYSIERAHRAMKILAEHDLINGHITDTNCYKVYPKDLCEIRKSL